MKVKFVHRNGLREDLEYELSQIPRVGDRVEQDYHPAPTVVAVIWHLVLINDNKQNSVTVVLG